jgi:membrane-bound metal-dependent hydrolase YbcI (DUF457 family)
MSSPSQQGISHLVLDFVGYEGVPWFWPFEEKHSLDLNSAGGLFVGSLGFLAVVLPIYLLQDHPFPAVVLLPGAGYACRDLTWHQFITSRTLLDTVVLLPLRSTSTRSSSLLKK